MNTHSDTDAHARIADLSVDRIIVKLAAAGIELPPGRVVVDSYGDSAELSAALIDLIRSGRKRAGTGLLWAYEADGMDLPIEGSIEVVVDHQNEPVLVTRLTSVRIVPFNQVDAGYAAIEGEGDGSLEYWRKGHRAFFGRECARLGRAPSEEMPVICCIFEVLNELPPRVVS